MSGGTVVAVLVDMCYWWRRLLVRSRLAFFTFGSCRVHPHFARPDVLLLTFTTRISRGHCSLFMLKAGFAKSLSCSKPRIVAQRTKSTRFSPNPNDTTHDARQIVSLGMRARHTLLTFRPKLQECCYHIAVPGLEVVRRSSGCQPAIFRPKAGSRLASRRDGFLQCAM